MVEADSVDTSRSRLFKHCTNQDVVLNYNSEQQNLYVMIFWDAGREGLPATVESYISGSDFLFVCEWSLLL